MVLRLGPIHKKYILIIILVSVCLLQVVAGYSHRDLCANALGADDAFISYRYAQNLMEGNGLVFNPGQRVEGYSNFLYVLMVAPAFLFLGGSSIYFYSSLLNILAIVVTFHLFYNYMMSVAPKQSFLAGLLFCLYPSFWVWTASGMETAVVLLLQIAFIVTVARCSTDHGEDRNQRFALILSVLLVLIRADGFILPFIAIIYFVIKRQYKIAGVFGAVLGLTLICILILRYFYYHDLLPNTVYAKVSGPLIARVSYSLQLLLVLGTLAGLMPFLYLVILNSGIELKSVSKNLDALRESISFENLFILIWIAYWIFIGGDVYYERFLLIVVPIGIIALAKIINAFDIPGAMPFISILIIIMYASIVLSDPRFSYSLVKYDCWQELGEYLAENHPGEVVATGAAGKIPYYSGLASIDMYGLNDKYIAKQQASTFVAGHSKFAPDYVFAQKPGLITGWLVGSNLDAGMTSEVYEKNGYRLTYLVFMRPNLGSNDPIINVTGLDFEDIQAFAEQGYAYAVLTRQNIR